MESLTRPGAADTMLRMNDNRVSRGASSPLVAFFFMIHFLGCGELEVGDPQIVITRPKPTSTPVPQPTATPEQAQVDFASLEEFPDLVFDLSGNISREEARSYPVMDWADPADERIWRTVAPATFEVTLPPGAKIYRIEVEGTEGATAFPECVVFIRSASDTGWRRPSGLSLEQKRGELIEGKGASLRHVFTFEETAAERALIGIAKGPLEDPDKVAVRDIDIFGYLRKSARVD